MNQMHISALTPDKGERVGTFGGSRSGKSSWMDWEMREVQRTRPKCAQLLLDTKPRFRGETIRHPWFTKQRRPARKLYQSWAAGPVIPNSVVVPIWEDHPFRGLWQDDRPGEIAVMQGETMTDWKRMLALTMAFVKAQWKNRERRIVVDETLDFYGRNTFSIDSRNDALYLVARAGGERHIGLELGAHRVHGIPPLILNQLSRVNLFHLRHDGDMRWLNSAVGIPDATSPVGQYIFRQWVVQPGGTLSEPKTVRATYPESYLSQLSTS